MLKMSSAVHLARSLKSNSSLTEVNVAYNSFADEGGQMVGDALHFNKTIKKLNISHNSIPPKAGYVIAIGVRNCLSIEHVNLSSNPIGEYGARALLMLNAQHADRVNVDFKECAIKIKDSSCTFDIMNPAGMYNLDLSKPYERAILCDILHLMSDLEDLRVKSARMTPDPVLEPRVHHDLNLVVLAEKKTSSAGAARIDSIRSIAADIFTARKIFKQFDVDSSGFLDR